MPNQRFFYASVRVLTIEIKAPDEKEAHALLRNHKYEGANKKKMEYVLHWSELPDCDITKERDAVLAQMLNLMQNVIPIPTTIEAEAEVLKSDLIVLPSPPNLGGS